MPRRIAMLLLVVVFSLIAAADAAGSGRRRSVSKPLEIDGVVTALSADQVTLRTRREEKQIRITSSTLYTVDGHESTADVLEVGDEVEARVKKESDGTLTALSIDVETTDDVKGVVTTVSATSLTVETRRGDVTFALTPETIVLVHGHRASVAAITPGMKVEVKWLRGRDRVAAVVQIKTELVEIEGVVTAVSSDSITVRKRSGEVTITVNDDTKITLDGDEATLSSIVVGSKVEVKALRNADGTLLAVVIKLEDENELSEIKGEIITAGTTSITVRTRSGDEVEVALTPDTIIRQDERRLTAADLQVGDQVEIKALSGSSGFTAVRIEVEEDDERFVEIEGKVTAITGSVLTVETGRNRSVEVTITSTTVIRIDDDRAEVSDLTVGDKVEITARRNTGGALEALYIEIDDDRDGEDHGRTVELEGTIEAVSAASITLTTRSGEETIAIDDKTVIKTDRGRGTLDDLEAGQRVEVKATRSSDGTYLATVIEIEDEDEDDDEDDD